MNETNANLTDCIQANIVVIAYSGTGETSFLMTYLQNGKFPDEDEIPIVLKNYRTLVGGPRNKTYELSLWDVSTNGCDERLMPFAS